MFLTICTCLCIPQVKHIHLLMVWVDLEAVADIFFVWDRTQCHYCNSCSISTDGVLCHLTSLLLCSTLKEVTWWGGMCERRPPFFRRPCLLSARPGWPAMFMQIPVVAEGCACAYTLLNRPLCYFEHNDKSLGGTETGACTIGWRMIEKWLCTLTFKPISTSTALYWYPTLSPVINSRLSL